jgi:hypothetical protein
MAAAISATAPGTGMWRLRRPLIAATSRRIFFQRDAFAPENVAMSNLPALHRKNQARPDIAHVDEVHDEIEIQVKTPAKEVPEHRCRRSKVVIVCSDWHRRSANY